LAHGAKFFADSAVRKAFPAIVVFPQCPANDYWPRVEVETRADGGRQFSFPFYEASGPSLGLVSGLIDSLLAGGRVDADRVYLGGLSMGAMGSYELLARRPKTFAAAMLICGGGHPQLMGLYAPHTPLWIFHGDADNVVPPDMSRRMVRAAEALGIAVRYSEYPGVGHDSWTPAFAEPELLKWLFAQRRSHN
jgi:predicted peptidase